MLKVNNIFKTFNQGTINSKKVLNGLNLNVNDGEFISIIGTNGAGKSTLMNAIAGSIAIDEGNIVLDGVDITNMKDYKRAKYIGRLFQDPMKSTAPNMTIIENLGLAYSRGSKRSLSWAIKKKDIELFKSILSDLDMGLEDRMDTKVKYLSGGQRQALTLIMATIKKPKLLLLDEHTAALDPVAQEKIMNITNRIINENKITTLMITHNLNQALNYGDRMIMLDRGKVAFELSIEDRKNLSPSNLIEKYNKSLLDGFSDEMLF